MSDEDVDKQIGRVVKALAASNSITLRTVAAELKVGYSSLGERLAGKRRFTAAELFRLAEYFEVSLDRFSKDPRTRTRCSPVSAGQPLFLVAQAA